MPRMNILNKSEQAMFEDPPIFNSAERKRFFTFPNSIYKKAATLRKPATQIGFLLSCGYFKATKKFFKPEDFHHNDIAYVAHALNYDAAEFISEQYVQSTRQWHQDFILEFYGYKRFDKTALQIIEYETASMMRSQLKPKLIFWRCIDILIRERVQTPAYFQLSELILTALNQRKKELSNIISQQLPPETKSLLDGLFAQETDSPYARYKLTLLKNLSQSSKPTQIKERCSDLQYLAELHEDLQPLLPILDLGYEGIQYFANSVIKSDIFQLNQRSEEDRYIHVVAFITHQYYRLQDNLVDTLLSAVKSFENGAKRNYKDWCFEQRKTQNQSLKTLASSIDTKVFGFVRQIKDIIGNDDSDAEKLALIKDLLEASQPDFLEAEREWSDFKSGLNTGAHDPHYFDILEERSLRLQNRVTPILKVLDLHYDTGAQDLAEAMDYFRKNNGAIRHNAPIDFLDDAEQKAVFYNDIFRPSLYKALLYAHVAAAIKSGQINLEHSYKYRSLDEYLIDRDRWKTERNELTHRAGLKDFQECRPVMNNPAASSGVSEECELPVLM